MAPLKAPSVPPTARCRHVLPQPLRPNCIRPLRAVAESSRLTARGSEAPSQRSAQTGRGAGHSLPAAPAPPLPDAPSLERLATDSLSRSLTNLGGEVIEELAALAARSQTCEVLEALSKAALVLRDAAVGAPRGVPKYSLYKNPVALQALFQQGYDISVALLQALPVCTDAYNPAAAVPEVCVSLFHIHNLMLQAAHASEQGLEPYTELMQAGLGLYVLKAPPGVVHLSSTQLDHVLEAMAQQDTGRFQRLLWVSLLHAMPSWSSLEDLLSVVMDCEQQAVAACSSADALLAQQAEAAAGDTRRGAKPTRGSSSAPDRHAELEEYGRLMSECIRTALECSAGALGGRSEPFAAARQLLDTVQAFDARQRSHTTPPSLRYTFLPTPEWLSQVAAAALGSSEQLSAAQVVQLLADLDALAPKPLDGSSSARRWLGGARQEAVETALLRRMAAGAWSRDETLQAIMALSGKCQGPPLNRLCVAVEGLMLACGEERHDATLLCVLLQDAVAFSEAGTQLSPAHISLVRVMMNRAICIVGSRSVEAARPGRGFGSAAAGAGGLPWSAREFLFERYPRLLRAAKQFRYPLEAFRVHDYANELYAYFTTAPGHELVAAGPEGFTRVLKCVASTPCCQDPQWVAALERALVAVVAVQFSVGYTHPKRWLGLLQAVVAVLPAAPMPTLAAGVKSLMVRLCDVKRHQEYMWEMLPLVGTLERRAAGVRDPASGRAAYRPGMVQRDPVYAHGVGWAPVDVTAGSGGASSSGGSTGGGARAPSPARWGAGGSYGGLGRSRSASKSKSPAVRPGMWTSKGSATAGGPAHGAGAGSSSVASGAGVRRAGPALPDLSQHLVSDEEFARWEVDIGQRLALSMAYAEDEELVAERLSNLGIYSRGG